MAIITQFSDKKVLVIDDKGGMRTQLQLSLTSSGFEKLHVVSGIKEALASMEAINYDIILCDYMLGESTNGQQFLEYLHHKNLISHETIFIMITGERSYGKVVAVAECAPDDYILKPFTAEQLNNRLTRLMEQQDRFSAVNRARDAGNWRKVVAECDGIIATRDKYLIDASKIKGEALLALNDAVGAEALYRGILDMRPLPWARLGLAMASALQGKKDQAAELAREVVSENVQFMGAYDFLGGVLSEIGKKDEALQVLQSAREVSPGTLARVRSIGRLAVDTGRHDVAEQVMSEALRKNRYSPVREAQDYALLSRALSEQGKPDRALKVLKEAADSFKDETSAVVLAASESVAHRKAGNDDMAEMALLKALAAHQGSMPASVSAAVADACYALGKEDKANSLLKQVVQNNPDDTKAHEAVHAVLSAAGKGVEEASAMIKTSVREIIQLNNEGVRKAEAGQFDEAVALLSDAADRLPNNLQIVGNAGLALALDLVRNGLVADKLKECLRYRQLVAEKSPDYPKLAQIDTMLKQVKTD